MMNRVLENDWIRLETRPRAGQMASLVDKKRQEEVLYQGDQGWSDQNPTLFPIVGSTWNQGKYSLDGKEYVMKNHGLIRYADLNEEGSDTVIRYVFDSSDATKAQYPFDFHYEMTYTIDGPKVIVRYAITNTGETEMPFSFGLHPAFKTARREGEAFEDFSIAMSPKAEATQIIFNPEGSPVIRKPVELDAWQLSREDLNTYATLVFEDVKATDAILKYKEEPRLRMHFEEYPYLALWSHPTPSDFVCIEPWFGHADFEAAEVPFDQREGTQTLAPGQTFTAGYELEVL